MVCAYVPLRGAANSTKYCTYPVFRWQVVPVDILQYSGLASSIDFWKINGRRSRIELSVHLLPSSYNLAKNRDRIN